jgi:hypothetical protein
LTDIEQDPYFQPFPAIIAAIKSREIDYQTVDADVRARLTELLGNLIFEAYVCFSRQQPRAEDLFSKMSAALFFQRLRAAGNEPVDVTLSPSSERREKAVVATTERAIERIRRTDRRAVKARVHTSQRTEPGSIVAEYVSQIVRARLSSPTSLDARAFERIHPTKLRLIQDFDRGEFFSRKRRFTE